MDSVIQLVHIASWTVSGIRPLIATCRPFLFHCYTLSLSFHFSCGQSSTWIVYCHFYWEKSVDSKCWRIVWCRKRLIPCGSGRIEKETSQGTVIRKCSFQRMRHTWRNTTFSSLDYVQSSLPKEYQLLFLCDVSNTRAPSLYLVIIFSLMKHQKINQQTPQRMPSNLTVFTSTCNTDFNWQSNERLIPLPLS